MAARLFQAGKVSTVVCLRNGATLAPTAPMFGLTPAESAFREKYMSRIGNRDVVGFGRNGAYQYIDCVTYPYPAIRWAPNTAETAALMKKAQGEWKALSKGEKQALYRHSFRQTFAEIKAPTSEWKIVFGLVILTLTVSCWVYMWMRNNVFDAMMPSTINKEHQQAVHARMLAQRQGLIRGFSSQYDYENNEWKK